MSGVFATPEKTRNLVIVGDSAFAEIACEYFTAHTYYTVVAFSVEQAFLKRTELAGRPVFPFETLADHFAPAVHDVFAAITYTQLNRVRARLAASAKAKGYRLASYVSPYAFVYSNAVVGEHCFIFENNVVQPFVTIADNVVLWSGNHIGHHSTIEANVFVSSHVVISGFCQIGRNCFLGVNASVSNNVMIAADCWIGPGVVVGKNTEAGELYRSPEPAVAKVSALRFFRVKD